MTITETTGRKIAKYNNGNESLIVWSRVGLVTVLNTIVKLVIEASVSKSKSNPSPQFGSLKLVKDKLPLMFE
jgi:hypothetical protein